MDKSRVRMFKEVPPCETHTLYEHLLSHGMNHRTIRNMTHGYLCPVFYNFAHPGRPNSFLQLLYVNNLRFIKQSDTKLFKEVGCHLVEVAITEEDYCSEKLFGEHEQSLDEVLLILLCSVLGNPLGENRTSYPDAELKKTIEANLTAAKAEFPTCKNGSWSLDFESVSKLVVDNSKLDRLFDNLTDGTNDDTTTAHCFVEVSLVYQQQYDFTFGAVSIDNKSLLESCYESEGLKCVRRKSAAGDEHKHFACCCPRHWNKTQDMCREIFLDQLKTLLKKNVIAETSEKIMGELTKDPLTKCVKPEETNAVQAGPDINRPCARKEGCYSSVHARDVPTSTLPKEYGGCVSEYAPDSTKRYNKASDEVEARFSRICRLARNQGECFAVLGTEDPDLPDDVKGPQMICCCRGRLGSAQKCVTDHEFGRLIGDFH